MRRRRCVSWVLQASEGRYEVANCLPLCFQCAEQENDVARKIAATVHRMDYSDVKSLCHPNACASDCTERGRLGKSRKFTLNLSINKLIPLHFPKTHLSFFLYHKTSNLYRGICIRGSSLLGQIHQAKICFFQALTRNWRPELWLLLPSSYRDVAMLAVGTRPEISAVMSCEKRKMFKTLTHHSSVELISTGEETCKYAFIWGVAWKRKEMKKAISSAIQGMWKIFSNSLYSFVVFNYI